MSSYLYLITIHLFSIQFIFLLKIYIHLFINIVKYNCLLIISINTYHASLFCEKTMHFHNWKRLKEYNKTLIQNFTWKTLIYKKIIDKKKFIDHSHGVFDLYKNIKRIYLDLICYCRYLLMIYSDEFFVIFKNILSHPKYCQF